MNVSAWLVWVRRGVWPAKPVGMAQPARPRRRAQTPPEPEACSPETHAGGRCCIGVASFRSPLWPPAGCRRSRHPAQLVPEVTEVTSIERIASASGAPYATRTSTWRSLEMISSGVCLFLRIVILLRLKSHTSGWTTPKGADQFGNRSFYQHVRSSLGECAFCDGGAG